MWPGTEDLKENIGASSANSSVGEISYSLAVAFPAANPCAIGGSLMQVTLSPQETPDLLFYLMNVMSTANANTTTPSTKTTSSSTATGLMPGLDPERQTRLWNDKGSHFKAKVTKKWTKRQYETEIQTLKEKLFRFRRLSDKIN
jgi:hypothetical protein